MPKELNTIYLKKNEDRRINAGHLWIYNNEIDNEKSPLKKFLKGELVYIKNSANNFMGIGYINPQTLLCARLLTRDINQKIDVAFFKTRITRALAIREKIYTSPYYRLIFSEGDYLPGLIIDRFNDIFVIQITTAGIENLKDMIVSALLEIFQIKGILFRNDSTFRELEGIPKYIKPIYFKDKSIDEFPQIVELVENDCKFLAPIISGQKTGWFYDQNFNRQHLKLYIKPEKEIRILDVFSYVGGWGIAAAKLGAKEVLCLDASATALEMVLKNADLNNLENIVKTLQGDAFIKLNELIKDLNLFDLIIIDPPAFIKKQKDLKTGAKAYLLLHELAIKLLISGGILISTSCSLHFSRDMLLDTIRQAGINCKKEIHILEQLHQSPDHPIHPAIFETNYLKGFVIVVY